MFIITKKVKSIPDFFFFTVFLKNRNIIFKMKISKVTEYAALTSLTFMGTINTIPENLNGGKGQFKFHTQLEPIPLFVFWQCITLVFEKKKTLSSQGRIQDFRKGGSYK